MTLEELVARRDALLKARISGLRSTEYSAGGVSRRSEYRTDREMLAALSDLERRIDAMQSARATPTTIRFATSKGM